MQKIRESFAKLMNSNVIYFLAALFFASPFLVMFPSPVTYVMVFGFLVSWVKWVELKKKES